MKCVKHKIIVFIVQMLYAQCCIIWARLYCLSCMLDVKVNISSKLHKRVTEMRYFVIKQGSVVFSQNEFEMRSAVKHELRKHFLPLGVAGLWGNCLC